MLELQPTELADELDLSPAEALELLQQVEAAVTGDGEGESKGDGEGSAEEGGAAAAGAASGGAMTAMELLKVERERKHIVTFCSELDRVLGGGVRSPSIDAPPSLREPSSWTPLSLRLLPIFRHHSPYIEPFSPLFHHNPSFLTQLFLHSSLTFLSISRTFPLERSVLSTRFLPARHRPTSELCQVLIG